VFFFFSLTLSAALRHGEKMKEKIKQEVEEYSKFFKELEVKLKSILACVLFVSVAVIVVNFVFGHINAVQLVSLIITMLFMLGIAVIDLKKYVVPNSILVCWFFVILLFIAIESLYAGSIQPLILSFVYAFIIFFLFLAVYYLTKKSLGGGDVKLSFVLGLAVAGQVFTAVFYALLVAAIFSCVAIVTKKLGKKDALPLGPFLFIGTVLAYVAQLL
jgi:prepilin signal peptidase PulO-like enzyme (type II secretory pathway)